MNFGRYFVQILVNRLFYIQRVTLYPINMLLDIGKRNHPFLHLPIRPNRLDAVGRPLLNYLVNWQLSSALSPLVRLESILYGRNGSDSFKKSLKEQYHLLILVDVDASIIVKD